MSAFDNCIIYCGYCRTEMVDESSEAWQEHLANECKVMSFDASKFATDYATLLRMPK